MVKFGDTKDVEKIGRGEEPLHKKYIFKNEPDRRETVLAYEDGGSTQTRGNMLDVKDLGHFDEHLDEVIVIPSTSASVIDDRVIEPYSDNLYDNLESQIVNMSVASDALFRNVRLVRGSKAVNVEMYENRLGSSTQKTSDATYYYNILDAIGYQALLKYQDRVPVQLGVYLSVSLPPDDLNEINQKRFRDNMKSFKWVHAPSGVSIQIDIVKIYTMTEPEAYAKGHYYTRRDGQIPDFTLHIEGGGRSIGAEILRYKKTLKGGQKTLDFGGNQLLNFLNDSYVQKYGGSRLRQEVLEEAIIRGTVRVGNETREVVDLIKQAKQQMAARIFHTIKREVFDTQTRVGLTDLNIVTVSGRLFDEGEYGVSVAQYLQKFFVEASEFTLFEKLEDNMIPQGLMLESMMEFFPNAMEEGEEESVVDEVAATNEQ